MNNTPDKFTQWVQRLTSKGLAVPAAFSYLEQAKLEAIERLLIQKGIFDKDEINNLHDIVAEEFVEKIEKMPALPR